MKAIKFKECNAEIAKNQPEYNSLPAFIDKEIGTITSCFELSNEELKQVRRTKKIWLTILTFNKPLQPIKMSLSNPFRIEESVESPFKIHHTTITSLKFSDRIKVLFGKKIIVNSEIDVDGDVVILKSSSSTKIEEKNKEKVEILKSNS